MLCTQVYYTQVHILKCKKLIYNLSLKFTQDSGIKVRVDCQDHLELLFS